MVIAFQILDMFKPRQFTYNYYHCIDPLECSTCDGTLDLSCLICGCKNIVFKSEDITEQEAMQLLEQGVKWKEGR